MNILSSSAVAREGRPLTLIERMENNGEPKPSINVLTSMPTSGARHSGLSDLGCGRTQHLVLPWASTSDYARDAVAFLLCSDEHGSRRDVNMSESKNETKPAPVLVANPDCDVCVSINSQQPMASAPSAPPPPKPKR